MNPTPENTRANAINALLPQTQCTRCGYQGCLPYAQAIATRAAAINQCPPGGAKTIAALAELLAMPILPLNPKHGIEQPLTVARIVEDICIGCTKCIQVCPVDAIVGMQKRMHTVIAKECTGCELCIPACPVDCIELVPDPSGRIAMRSEDSSVARARFELRNQRLLDRELEQAARIEAKRQALRSSV
jgi:Na+-translocating ferredoxin:NAD+ oxidoreductase subunit B